MSLSFDNSEAGCMLLYDCHRSVPAPFLTKTYHLVNDPSTDEIVSWGEDHTTFVVWHPPEFARDLLPKYFKHNNFSSFVRQLNTYGFRKVVPDRWEFANDFFRRGERHLLCEIHRRKAPPAPGTSGSAQQSRSLSPSTSLEDQGWGSPISSPLPSPLPVVHIVAQPPPQQQQQQYQPQQQQYQPQQQQHQQHQQHQHQQHQHHHHQQQQQQHPNPPIPPSPLSMSDDNERLRKDNTMLLTEVSRLRRLLEANMVQHQFQGSSSELFSTLVSSARVGAAAGGQSSDRALQQQSAAVVVMGPAAASARREEHHHHVNRELSVHVRHTLQGPTSINTVPDFFRQNSGPLASSSASSLSQFSRFQEPQLHQHQNHGDTTQQLHASFFTTERMMSVPASTVVSPTSTATEFRETKHHSPPPVAPAPASIPVKLFGVPLHKQSNDNNNNNNNNNNNTTTSGQLRQERTPAELPRAGTKRQHPEAPWEVASEHSHSHSLVQFPRPPRKCLGTSEILAGSDPLISRPAPWLQICATRDKGVYI